MVAPATHLGVERGDFGDDVHDDPVEVMGSARLSAARLKRRATALSQRPLAASAALSCGGMKRIR